MLFGVQAWFVHSIVSRRRQPTDTSDPIPEIAEIGAAAVMSGAFISVLVAPMEGVKARLQVRTDAGACRDWLSLVADVPPCLAPSSVQLGFVRGKGRAWIVQRTRGLCTQACDGPTGRSQWLVPRLGAHGAVPHVELLILRQVRRVLPQRTFACVVRPNVVVAVLQFSHATTLGHTPSAMSSFGARLRRLDRMESHKSLRCCPACALGACQDSVTG